MSALLWPTGLCARTISVHGFNIDSHVMLIYNNNNITKNTENIFTTIINLVIRIFAISFNFKHDSVFISSYNINAILTLKDARTQLVDAADAIKFWLNSLRVTCTALFDGRRSPRSKLFRKLSEQLRILPTTVLRRHMPCYTEELTWVLNTFAICCCHDLVHDLVHFATVHLVWSSLSQCSSNESVITNWQHTIQQYLVLNLTTIHSNNNITILTLMFGVSLNIPFCWRITTIHHIEITLINPASHLTLIMTFRDKAIVTVWHYDSNTKIIKPHV